jgi:phage tail-like protein
MWWRPEVGATDDPFTTFRFEVVLDLDSPADGISSPLCDAAFAECDGLEMTMEPKTVAAGGLNTEQIHLVGPVRYSQLTLRRGMTSTLDLWSWFALVGQTGRVSTASGTITMWDSAGNPAVVFSLEECLPVKMRAPSLNARDGLVAIEELGLVYRRLAVSTPSGGGIGIGFGISARAGIGAGAAAGAGVGGGIGISGGVGAGLSFSGSAQAAIGLGS